MQSINLCGNSIFAIFIDLLKKDLSGIEDITFAMRNRQEWFNEKMAAVSPEIVSEVQLSADKDPGNTLAQAKTNFGAMNPHDSNFFVPPITEVPDYVWARKRDTPKDIGRRIFHPNAEAALQAAKKACRSRPGQWYGRSSTGANVAEFLVYEGIKVVERHVVGY